MEDGDNKVEIELGKDRKSYAGIPEADFVVSAILLIFILRMCSCHTHSQNLYYYFHTFLDLLESFYNKFLLIILSA